MARTDLSKANGWIPEPTDGNVIQKLQATSAIEQVARKVTMTSNSVRVPRFDATSADIVAEGALIPQVDATLDNVLLEATKFADRFTISEEDNADSVVNVLDAFKVKFASDVARKLDNAALGATGTVAPGTNTPFLSVYAAATASGNVVPTAGNLEFEMLNDVFSAIEIGDYNANTVILAHPSFAGALRNLKDESGLRVVTEPLGGGNQTIFGIPVVYTSGARKNAGAAVNPTGNPLLIVGNSDHLLLGVRSGIESQVDAHRWEYDERELKVRARYAFTPATGAAFHVLEKTGA